MADKNNVIVGKDRNNIEVFAKSPSNTEATSYKIPITKLRQNSHSKWMMFSATLSGSMEVPPANSKSRGIAMFGAIDDTLHFRIEAKNIHEDTGAQLRLRKQGKNGNVIADLVEPGKHASTTQVTIIKGSITGSSLIGLLEGQPISKLIKLIEEEKVSVNLYLSSRRRQIKGIIHRSGRAR